jgi:hypothetical protein
VSRDGSLQKPELELSKNSAEGSAKRIQAGRANGTHVLNHAAPRRARDKTTAAHSCLGFREKSNLTVCLPVRRDDSKSKTRQ